jgi:hypothetical protein
MTRYQLSRIAVVFFGLTTIAIFLYASSGSYYGLFGSTELGLGVYFVNIALLVVSLIVFIWERAHKDMPRHTEEILLEKKPPSGQGCPQ